jgi:hypothetical protein
MSAEGSKVPNLEYNLAGGLLLTINDKDFSELQSGLKESGYSSACVLPFRALTKESGMDSLKHSPLSIIHIEEAWNPTSEDHLGKAVIAGLLGYYNKFQNIPGANPIVQDAFFPSEKTCKKLFDNLLMEFPQAKFISHQIDINFPENRLLVEINPGIKLEASELLAKAEQKGIGLVFDPSHLLPTDKSISLPGQSTKNKNEWEKQFNYFSSKIEVVDINPPDKNNDVKELISGKGLIKEMVEAAKGIGVEVLRVEIPIPAFQQLPSIRPHSKGFEFLKEIGNAIMGYEQRG